MQNSAYRRQAAAIAIYQGKVCIITSRNRSRWVIPKGGTEPGMTCGEVALQEAWEEAGLTGVLHPQPVGTYTYEKSGNRYRVTVFVMEVTHVSDDYPERDERSRCWLPPDRALLHLGEPGLRRLMQKVVDSALATLQV